MTIRIFRRYHISEEWLPYLTFPNADAVGVTVIKVKVEDEDVKTLVDKDEGELKGLEVDDAVAMFHRQHCRI